MITTDRDGLSAVQIARINRLELARFRKPQKQHWIGVMPIVGLLVGTFLIESAAVILIQNHWSPGTQLYTRLPANLDEQAPSITIYGR